jgi:hypothetical protein
MVMVRIIKIPRATPISDLPIRFPPLGDIHLDLLENKKKLKPGLPLIPFFPPKPKPAIAVLPPTKEEIQKHNSEEDDRGHRRHSDDDRSVDSRHGHGSHHSRDDRSSESGGLDDFRDDVSVREEDDDRRSDRSDHHSAKREKEEPQEPVQSRLSPAEQERLDKEEMLWRFRILKKQYTDAPLPEFNEHSDLNAMKISYDRTIRELYFEDSLSDYQTYLTYAFWGLEFVCVHWMDIKELQGFSQAQSRYQKKYDRLLIELGEKNYTRWGARIPVEIRLIGLVIFQAAAFYVGKMIQARFMGEEDKTKKQGSKMKGPSVKLEDLDDSDKNKQ